MRKIVVLSMISLDGVLQGPGAPEEDTSGGFKYGGWVAPFQDEASGEIMKRLMRPADVFLGRKTFEIWENYWPQHERIWPGINDVNKYVFSATRHTSGWKNSVFIKDVEGIKKIKSEKVSGGKNPDIQVWGSSQLIQLLLKNDLVDELWLMIHPITLGKGKRLFNDGPIPAAFKLLESRATPSGVIFANYGREGEVKTGRAGE